ncbi:MAG: BatA domain-containing protein [Phycisphaerae bacterium]
MFLMGSILLGSLLAVIPLVIHMLRKQKSEPIAWGAMQFLLETPLKARRRRSIDNWVLMLIRMAILVFLAFALARPMIRGNTFVSSTPMDVAVVIDHSFSMGRRGSADAGGSGTLFDEGVQVAEKLSAMLPSSATMSIVLAEHSPRTITPLPTPMDASSKSADGAPRGEWGSILQQLHALKPGITDANIPQAIEAATEVINRGRNLRKLVLVVSDEQRSNWGIGSDAVWGPALAGTRDASGTGAGGIPVYALPVETPPSMPNVSVSSLTIQPAFLGVHRPAQVTATIVNSGTTTLSNIPVQLIIDGQTVANRQLPSLAPGHSNTMTFDEYFPASGSHWVRIRADVVDGLEADNAATTAVNVSPQLPVLLVDGELSQERAERDAACLRFAMQPVDASVDPTTLVVPKVISVADIDRARLDEYPIVILDDVASLPAATVGRLSSYVQSGRGLWIILGPRTHDSFLNNILGKSAIFPASAKPPVRAERSMGIDIKDPEHPALAQITAAQRNAFAGTALFSWWPLSVKPEMHTVLATTSGDPLMTDLAVGGAGGRVITWTTPASDLASSWNNFALVPNFTPLVNETLFHLAASQAKSQNHDLAAGQPLVWNAAGTSFPAPLQSATIITPNGAAHTANVELRGDQYFINYKDTFAPGLYELRLASSGPAVPAIFYTVNLGKEELDPATLSPADIEWLKNSKYLRDHLNMTTLPTALHAQVGGAELWWLLATLVLLLLLAETFTTWRLMKRQTSVDPETAGLVTTSAAGGGR